MQQIRVQSTTTMRNANKRSTLTSLVYSYLITRLLLYNSLDSPQNLKA